MLKPIRIAFCTLLFAASLVQARDTFAQRETRYHLHPGDVLTVNYRYTPEYNATVSVEPDGFATFPLIGDLKVGGLTIDQSITLLKDKASDRLNNPEITIDLKEFEKPYYIVGGDVGAPGRFEIRGPVTALRAIEMAGGLKYTSKTSQILLIRPMEGSAPETKIINLNHYDKRYNPNEDVELRAGDMLIVPKNKVGKIEPYIKLINAGFYLNPLGF
jgi:polysaccharide export outer membrane protein